MRPLRFFSYALLTGALVLPASTALHAEETTQTAAKVARPASLKNQAPGFFRFLLGDFTVTALYDGYVPLDKKLFHAASEEEKDELLSRSFIDSANGIQTAVNGYLIDTGKKLILVDAGAAKKFGDTLGAIGANIRAAGYDTNDVDIVLLTHMHPDHTSGLLTPQGKMLFPHATIYASKLESEYWLDKKNIELAPEIQKPFFPMAQEAIEPYKKAGKFRTFDSDQQIIEHVVSASSAGHTPGHTGYLITSKDASLLIWGDVLHSAAMQFSKPEISIEYDVDSVAAIASRQRVLSDSAARKLLVAGAHLPFPGVGHIRKETVGYSWIPLEYGPVKQATSIAAQKPAAATPEKTPPENR